MGVAALVSGKVAKRSRKASRTTACMRRHAPPSALTNTSVSRLSRARRSEASGVGRDHAAQIGVQVVQDGRAIRRLVKTGPVRDDRVEILSGLRAGETVLANPIREG